MSKYSGLPDIDTAPDVFETPDDPEAPTNTDQTGAENDGPAAKPISTAIDASGLPERSRARRTFATGTEKSTLQDSYLFTSRSRHPSSSSDEDSAPETSAARLRRLKTEVAELEHQIANEPASSISLSMSDAADSSDPTKRRSVLPPRPPVDLLNQVATLRTRLGAIDLGPGGRMGAVGGGENLMLRLIGEEGGRGESASQKTQEMSSLSSSSSSLAELDRRLATLETVIGPSEGSASDDTVSPVVPTLAKLDHLVSLLTQPRHLDAISRRVKLLLVELDRAATASRRPGGVGATPHLGDKTPGGASSFGPGSAPSSLTLSASDHANLQSIFALLPRLDPLLPVLPPLLGRLKSLASLHADASEISAGLRTLQSEGRQTGAEVEEMKEVVEAVKKGLEDAVGKVEGNWNAVNERVKALEKRMEAIAKA